MDIKAVFFDLDGTLFTSTRGVATSTRKAIQELRQKDIFVGIATGRGPAFVMPLLEDLDLDFAVSYNGQYIFTPKEVIFQNPLEQKSLKNLINYATENYSDISLGTAHGVNGSGLLKFGETRLASFLSGVLPSGTSGVARNSFKHIIRRVLPQNSNLADNEEEVIYQAMMVATRNETARLQEAFPELLVTRSNPYSVDLISKSGGKLPGIQRLGEHYGFTLDQVMCFGDSENDLTMISGVGYGIAMGNAVPEVKKIATYITDTNNQDGIAKALAYYGLIHYSVEKDFVSKDQNFNKVKDFHRLMDGKTQEIPKAFSPTEASFRADFKVEEIVEFLYASADGNQEKFTELVNNLHQAVDKAANKVTLKEHNEDSLTGQVDAMIDLLYFTYGSLVLSGIDPYEIFNAVHRANMGKIFPDGRPHFDPITHKVLKPEDWEEKFAPEGKIKKELERQKRVAAKKHENK
ncbi:Cof-type HAD-IIB family hydrolase [Lactococcus lactis]|uniref:Cof-type HAD-IIB family hydrolase n=1 Tax=Lactococcus lactis TaxID=1358 RepID=UPI00207C6346|nr:Cof-type HAD-IIB family hydrolase [Lactococcus lactis]MCO0816456.1 Cof-type HAD-IIB family hydrolase [Lactococcus lactis]